MPATVPDVKDEFDDEQAQVAATERRPDAAPTLPCLFPCPFFHV